MLEGFYSARALLQPVGTLCRLIPVRNWCEWAWLGIRGGVWSVGMCGLLQQAEDGAYKGGWDAGAGRAGVLPPVHLKERTGQG